MLRIGRTGDRAYMHFKTDADQESGILFGDVDDDVECAIEYEPANKALTFSTNNNTETMRLDSSGSVGINVTPSADWSGNSVLQMSHGAFTSSSSFGAAVSTNVVATASGWSTKYLATGAASAYLQATSDGSHRFYTAASGSAGASASLSERMRINSSGQVLMGSTSHADDILYLTRSGHNKMLRFYSGANESGWIGSYTTGALMIGSGDVALTFRTDSDSIYPVTDQVSGRDNAVDLGHPSVRFDDIYATNGTIQTSDRNEKNTITDSDLGLDFVKKLTPKSYKYNGKTRTHYGLVAQDVETVLSDISKPTENFAGFIKSDTSEEGDGSSYRYGLRYHEFIAPMLKAIQELSTELETAKARIKTLEDA
jgi:hypothetical protein